MKKIYVAIFLALLLFGCTSMESPEEGEHEILASGMCPGIENNFFIPEWEALAVLALAASAGILALLFVINRFFGNEAGEAQVKLELIELATTAFIIVVIIALLNAACGIRMGAILAPEGVEDLNLFDAAAEILNQFSSDLLIVATLLHTVYIPFDFLTTATLTQHPMGMGTVLQPTAGIGAVLKPAYVNSLQMIAIAFVVVRAQLMVLDFSTFAMLKFYLPLGIIMRAFTPTRRIGGTLIGLTLGLVLVFPMLIVLNGYTISSMNPFALDEYFDQLGTIVEAAWEPLTTFSESSLSTTEPLGVFVWLKTLVQSLFGTVIGVYYSLMMRTAAVAFLIGIFFPAMNTLILVTTIRYLTKAFGEEIDITSLTRMI